MSNRACTPWSSAGRRRGPLTCPRALRLTGAWLVFSALWGAPLPIGAVVPRASEYEIKAAFLYSFPTFVEWPQAALPDTGGALTIGILGEDPFGEAFAAFAGRLVKGRPVDIRRSTRLQELPLCHVLFVSSSEARYLPQILEHLRGRSVLTVGDSEGFARAGGMINFVLRGNKVHFEINPAAAERANLQLSAKLLRLAIIVEEGQQ